MTTPFIGEVRIVSFNFAPRNWALCNGQFLSINQNQALFSLLGTTYGGNGQTTFALPNLQGASPLHFGSQFTLGQTGGETNHTLTVAEMPAHTHALQGTSRPGTDQVPTNLLLAAHRGGYSDAPDVTLSNAALANTGGSQPHENRPPYLVLNFVIALAGIFPSRN